MMLALYHGEDMIIRKTEFLACPPMAALCLVLPAAIACALGAKPTAMPVPEGTKLDVNFGFDSGAGPEALLDGDRTTFMMPASGSARRPAALTPRFPQPMQNLAGVVTGDAEPYHNYYAREMRLFVDTTGDGFCETDVGMTTNLDPAAESRGQHVFQRKPVIAHALEIVVVRQNQQALNRAFTLNELQLLTSDADFGDPDLQEPEGGIERLGPSPIDADQPTPVVLLDMDDRPRFRVNRDRVNRHSGRSRWATAADA
jgi:hypothetical protein